MVPVVTGQYPKPMKTHASKYNTNPCHHDWGGGGVSTRAVDPARIHFPSWIRIRIQ